MALFKRIGTTSFLYRDSLAEDGQAQERAAIIRTIGEAGALGIDILLFQEEFSFWRSDVEDSPGRGAFAPARAARDAAPRDERYIMEYAMTRDDPYVQRVREAARAAGVNVALPLLEREGAHVYNSILPISARGDLLRPYRKMFPVPAVELSTGITPGTCNTAQEIAGVPVSFAICFDVHFDEVFTQARKSGARLVLWSSMWMGGAWLRAQALRNGLYVVSATPDGCTFVDIDGSLIGESPSLWPQTVGQNTIVFEDLNFDREVLHCNAGGALNEIRKRYGPRVHMRNRPQDSNVIIESLDPALPIGEIMKEFGLKSWFQYIEQSREAAARAGKG
jgi:predicted amidohydrolase